MRVALAPTSAILGQGVLLLLVFRLAPFAVGEKQGRKEAEKENALAVLGLAPHVGNSARMVMRVGMMTAVRMSVRPVIVDRSAALGLARSASNHVETPRSARLVVQDAPSALALAMMLPVACLGFALVAAGNARTLVGFAGDRRGV